LGHFQPFRSRRLASVRNCIQTRMWRRRGMISSWENPHYLKVNAVAHYSSSDQCPATTYARPAFAVDEPNHSAARVRSIEPPPTGLHPPTAPARLFRPCSCASIDHDATAGPPQPVGRLWWRFLASPPSSEFFRAAEAYSTAAVVVCKSCGLGGGVLVRSAVRPTTHWLCHTAIGRFPQPQLLWLLLPPAAPIPFRGTRGRGGV
jgi:hypothetical protein